MAYFSDDGDDSWLDNLTLDDVFGISQETTGLGEKYFGTGKDISAGETMGPMLPPGQEDLSAYQSSGDNAIGGRTSGRGSASPGGMSSGPDDGGSIFDGLEKFTRDNEHAIGLGATALGFWAKTISDNRNASQAADAAEMQRQQKEQDYADALALKREQDAAAIARADAKDKLDWERKQQLLQEQRDYEREVAKQKQADAMAQLAYSRSSSGGGGGGGGFDPAAARAARISASLVGQKAPTTGIVNSNIWGNALNTLQKR